MHVCKLIIVSLLVANVFILFFEMLECYSSPFNQKIANCIIQLLNSGLKNARKIIKILYFLSNADTSATNLLNFNVLMKKDDQQDIFLFTQLELNMSEVRKSKN